MLDYLLQYTLFFAEAATIVAAVGAVIVIGVSATRREHGEDHLEVRDLGERYTAMARLLNKQALSKKAFKAYEKTRTRAAKEKSRAAEARPRMFVITFKGDIRASAVASLREEVTAILTTATPEDEVLIRLENAGGLVYEHGLAASQLLRIKRKGIPLTVSVDKVAASGGYMMACVADRILAAPFAVLGSIGVLAQMPNFNRWLDQHGIDFEQIKGGEFKRTVTVFGKNTEADREKLKEEIEDMHAVFKSFVAEHRPGLDIERVATGEHWLATRAIEFSLCDALMTSDDYLLESNARADLHEVRYRRKQRLGAKLAGATQALFDRAIAELWRKRQESQFGL